MIDKSPVQLRAAVIGVGIGRNHARGYAQSDHAQLVSICDLDLPRAQALAAEFGVTGDQAAYADYHQMLAEVKPDIVSVCLPNYLHAEVAIAALEAGAHVICEKPMAINVADAEKMIATAERVGRRLALCYNYRYFTDAQWMKRAISEGALGDIYHVDVQWRRETGIPGRGWFGNKKLSGGGPLIDLGVHLLDLSLWCMDFPAVQTVSASTRSVFGARGLKISNPTPNYSPANFTVEDGAIGFLRLVNGATMSVQATWAEHRQPRDDFYRIEIQGSRGTITLTVLNYKHEDTIQLYTIQNDVPVTITPGIAGAGHGGHEALISATVQAIKDNTPLPADGAQGLAAVRILEAMYQSATTSAEVRMSDLRS